ncbi:alpha/beta fold hydrolase [Amycolatopsis sp. NPDC051045]|uniref:alpha/beta fold hydrolase n=1 Tax=Amycolatopsis sp. NPDC051045 TaxID=3156922 RepID=UPI0034134D09
MGRDYYTAAVQGPHEHFALGACTVDSGVTLPDARLAYRTHGRLNAARDNAVLVPHMYSGTSAAMEGLIGEGRALDPSRYFIILPDQLGSGLSSSPSNTPAPFDGPRFPAVTVADDVRAQYRLVTEQFGLTSLHAVIGWSMGGLQTYEWAVRYPETVQRAGVFAATAKTPVQNRLFIDVHTELLRSDPAFADGSYADSDDVHVGLARHAMAFAAAATSRRFFREEVWRRLGFSAVEEFTLGFMRGHFAPMDPNNLLCQAAKWRDADVSRHTGGDMAAALGRITARFFAYPFGGDEFFPAEDHEPDVALIRDARLRVIDSPLGHFTMFGLLPEDVAAIDDALAEVLKS